MTDNSSTGNGLGKFKMGQDALSKFKMGQDNFKMGQDNLTSIMRNIETALTYPARPQYDTKIFDDIAKQKREDRRREIQNSENIKATAQNTQQIKELLASMSQTLNIIADQVERETELSNEAKIQMNQLLCEIKNLSLSEETPQEVESKMIGILKTALSVGGKAATALMVEFVKYEAKLHGFPMN